MKNDEFLSNLRANKDDINYLDGLNKNKKENIKIVTDLLEKYRSQLEETSDEIKDRVNEVQAVINVLIEVLTKINK